MNEAVDSKKISFLPSHFINAARFARPRGYLSKLSNSNRRHV